MPRFWYVTEAEDARRQFVQGDNICDALLRLRQRGITVAAAGPEQATEPTLTRGVPERLLPSVYEHLAAMLEDGVSLPLALRTLAAEARGDRLRRSLSALASRVEDGALLSEAMAEQPKAYPPLALSVVAAAEEAGNLPEGLRSLTEHQRELAHLATQAAFPMVYPLVVITIVFSLLLFVVTFITPKYIKLFTDLGIKRFPPATELLIAFVRISPWLLVVLGIPALLLILFYLSYRRTSRGRFDLQLLHLRLPLFGKLSLFTATARMSAALSLLLRGGVQADRALCLAGQASGNDVVALSMRRAAAASRQGDRLSEGLRQTTILPDTFTFALGAAEASGELTETLDHLAVEYMRRGHDLARLWATISGPIIVLMLGVMVGLIGFGLFSPLLSVISSLSQ